MKYKKAESEGWYYFIDHLGNKGQTWTEKNKPGFYAEMMAWVAKGNEIEPLFNAEELAAKEKEEAFQALKTQNQTCQNLLDKSDKRMVSDWPYPEDKAKNEFFRAELRLCMASEKLVDIPKDPFG